MKKLVDLSEVLQAIHKAHPKNISLTVEEHKLKLFIRLINLLHH